MRDPQSADSAPLLNLRERLPDEVRKLVDDLKGYLSGGEEPSGGEVPSGGEGPSTTSWAHVFLEGITDTRPNRGTYSSIDLTEHLKQLRQVLNGISNTDKRKPRILTNLCSLMVLITQKEHQYGVGRPSMGGRFLQWVWRGLAAPRVATSLCSDKQDCHARYTRVPRTPRCTDRTFKVFRPTRRFSQIRDTLREHITAALAQRNVDHVAGRAALLRLEREWRQMNLNGACVGFSRPTADEAHWAPVGSSASLVADPSGTMPETSAAARGDISFYADTDTETSAYERVARGTEWSGPSAVRSIRTNKLYNPRSRVLANGAAAAIPPGKARNDYEPPSAAKPRGPSSVKQQGWTSPWRARVSSWIGMWLSHAPTRLAPPEGRAATDISHDEVHCAYDGDPRLSGLERQTAPDRLETDGVAAAEQRVESVLEHGACRARPPSLASDPGGPPDEDGQDGADSGDDRPGSPSCAAAAAGEPLPTVADAGPPAQDNGGCGDPSGSNRMGTVGPARPAARRAATGAPLVRTQSFLRPAKTRAQESVDSSALAKPLFEESSGGAAPDGDRTVSRPLTPGSQ